MLKQKTIHNWYSRWADYFGVPKPGINFMEECCAVYRKYKIYGTYKDSLIKLYLLGMNREVVKHEFIHYLRDYFGLSVAKKPIHFMSRPYNKEERIVRKWTCRSLGNIKESIWKSKH